MAADTRRQRAVGSRAALRSGPCFFGEHTTRAWVYNGGQIEELSLRCQSENEARVIALAVVMLVKLRRESANPDLSDV